MISQLWPVLRSVVFFSVASQVKRGVQAQEQGCLPYALKTYSIATYLDSFQQCRSRGGNIAVLKERLTDHQLKMKGLDEDQGANFYASKILKQKTNRSFALSKCFITFRSKTNVNLNSSQDTFD